MSRTHAEQALLDSLVSHLAILDARGRVIRVNAAWRRFARAHSAAPDALCEGANYLAVCDRVAGADALYAAAAAQGIRGVLSGDPEPFHLEYPCHSPAEQRWFELTACGLHHGARLGATVSHYNVTSRKLSELQLRDLNAEMIRELDHRVKNTLAVVASVAALSGRYSGSVQEFRAAFSGRVQALSRAHHMIAGAGWGAVALRALVDEILGLAAAPRARLRLSGDDVWLRPKAVTALALIVHELASNALRFGAWAAPAGTVEMAWRVRAGGAPSLELTWTERAGAALPPGNPPGFGLTYLEAVPAYELDGEGHARLEPAGFRYRMTMPMSDSLVAPSGAPGGRPPA